MTQQLTYLPAQSQFTVNHTRVPHRYRRTFVETLAGSHTPEIDRQSEKSVSQEQRPHDSKSSQSRGGRKRQEY